MSFGVGLNSAILGLNAARFGLQIAGQNIANVNTPGYTRQRALLGSTFPIQSGQGFYIGTGVQVDTVNRILDGRLEARIRTQNGLFGFADTHFRRMSEIEGVLGEPGENGLSGLMNGFFGSIGKLRSSAGSRALRGGMIQSAKTMASGFNLLASRYEDMRSDTFQEIEAHLREVNTFAKTVANLNAQIVTLEATGHKANDLRDRREIAINHLSELMDTQAIERDDGVLDVLAGGYLLVSGSRASDLSATKNPDGTTKITVGSTTTGIQISEGRISALLESEKNRLPGILSKLDLAARTIALEVNRLHTTGINKRGPFTSLASDNPIKDGDNDGKFTDELLVSGDFPFEITNGDLYVTVTNLTTKNIERTRIAINPTSMSLGDLSNAIDAIDHLNANVDPTGRLRISSESGFGFDFSNALDPLPNSSGTFGGTSASLGGNVSGPFNFSTLPASFNIAVDGGPATAITLNSNDFKVPSSVSAIELSQVLNGKFAAVTLNVTA
ncbi:MAG: flagellar hook-associated protein FlgK, partial [Planctomycetota bacterium]